MSLVDTEFHCSVAISQVSSQIVSYSISRGNSVRVYNTVAALTVILLNFNVRRQNTTTAELLVDRDNNRFTSNYALKTESI